MIPFLHFGRLLVPTFGLMIGLAIWRFIMRERAAHSAPAGYLALATIAAATMMGAGYWGGEMMIGQ